MNRNEAILRELNLYPLWVRRTPAAQAAGTVTPNQPEQPVQPAQRSAPPEVQVPPVPTAAPAPAALLEKADVLAGLAWPELKECVRDCQICRLRGGCTQTVFGVGDEKARWLFVGEGPGADEDAQGEPFVGQAGKLLDNMLMAIRLKRGSDVYIANVVKCRPPGNRAPEPDEVAACLPYLQRQIALLQPKVIVALGKTAANALLGRDVTLGSLRGTLHEYRGIPLVVTYHPAYLLRTPADKAKAWQDLRLAVSTMQANDGE
ncbi:MAG TPA: uracil-DNA glycosylase [Gallionellaceae bacterium]|nr:uracil-DNA glycosylase [Gallionellaceae bacterium]